MLGLWIKGLGILRNRERALNKRTGQHATVIYARGCSSRIGDQRQR